MFNIKTTMAKGKLATKRENSLHVYFQLFKKNGIAFLEEQNQTALVEMLLYANKLYYNNASQSTLTDNEYDILKEFIEKRYPKNKALIQIGAPVKKNKVQLPYEMWSMDKVKPTTNALEKFVKKYSRPKSYIVSAKLDGVSGLYSTEGGTSRLYTRGDGRIGQDVSHMIPYLDLPKERNVVIRGEFIMKKSVFSKEYSGKKTNARNVVSGIVNKLKMNADEYKRLVFVAYEVVKPELTPKEQYKLLEHLNMEVAVHRELTEISNDNLSSLLLEWREYYDYEIDGVVCYHNKKYPRKSRNPEHAFAFKMVITDQIAEAKVLDVLWSASKDGYLKPKIQIEPVELQGVTIEYATGFNAAFIKQHKLGPGAVVEIIRSGDVIPYIKSVKQSASHIKWPSVDYVWNNTNIDILLTNPNDDEDVKKKNIALFFKKIGVEGLSEGNVRRIYESGYQSILEFLSMTKSQFLEIEGFKEKMATKLHTNIEKSISDADLLTLMVASNLFGRGLGQKKLDILLQDYPNVFQDSSSEELKVKKVTAIDGFASKTAELFVSKIEIFKTFLREIGQEDKLKSPMTTKTSPKTQTHALHGKKCVFTGFRDKALEEKVKLVGGDVMSSVSKYTDLLIVKDELQTSSKIEKAKSLGVKVVTQEVLMGLL